MREINCVARLSSSHRRRRNVVFFTLAPPHRLKFDPLVSRPANPFTLPLRYRHVAFAAAAQGAAALQLEPINLLSRLLHPPAVGCVVHQPAKQKATAVGRDFFIFIASSSLRHLPPIMLLPPSSFANRTWPLITFLSSDFKRNCGVSKFDSLSFAYRQHRRLADKKRKMWQ